MKKKKKKKSADRFFLLHLLLLSQGLHEGFANYGPKATQPTLPIAVCSFIGIQTHAFIHILSTAVFLLRSKN